MNIHAHIITWNREDSLHLTVNYYKSFCSKIFIYDNFSDDRTREIAEEMGCIVSTFGRAGSLDDGEYLKVKNNCWKGSDADYVIVCDDDEILLPLNNLINKDVSIYRTEGYDMFSETVPRETWLDCNKGIRNKNYDKLIFFDPNRIKEINYVYGCHEAKPTGDINWSNGAMKLLHYRSIGGVDRLIKRHHEYVSRLSPINKKWNLGHHYSQSDAQKRKEWKESIKNCETLFEGGIT
jgi:glycosyltransferase involved in cell wall biosynthesis